MEFTSEIDGDQTNNLLSTEYYLLMASGELEDNGAPGSHSDMARASSGKINFAGDSAVTTTTTTTMSTTTAEGEEQTTTSTTEEPTSAADETTTTTDEPTTTTEGPTTTTEEPTTTTEEPTTTTEEATTTTTLPPDNVPIFDYDACGDTKTCRGFPDEGCIGSEVCTKFAFTAH